MKKKISNEELRVRSRQLCWGLELIQIQEAIYL